MGRHLHPITRKTTKMKIVIAFAVVFLFFSCKEEHKPKYDLIIKNVGLFDGFQDQGEVNIAITNDSIVLITTDQIENVSKDTINGKGKYVIPGLVNSHVHLSKPEDLKAAFNSGVLAVIDLHKSSEETAAFLRTYRDSLGYASFYSSGFAATLPGGHPTQYGEIETINDSVTPAEFVTNRLKNGADLIKLIRDGGGGPPDFQSTPTLNDEQIKEIIASTHDAKRLCIAHTVTLKETVEIAEFGVDGFAHLWFGNESASDDQLAQLKKEKVFVIPTALTQVKIWQLVAQGPPPIQEYASTSLSSMEMVQNEILRIYEAGIPILAGNDPPNFEINPSDDLLEELDIYSKSGLSNSEVLKTATGNPARVFNLNGIGLLEEGKAANFLLLGSNPIVDLSALRHTEGIWKDGTRVK